MENANLKTILAAYGFTFKKAYGQNFLTDENLLDGIAESAGVTKDDVVLEIGCGAGALTAALARKAKKVIGYEIDASLKPVLSATTGGYDNVEIIFKDVMKEDFAELEKRLPEGYILAANLPYYITTPIIMRFLENSKKIKALAVMVQEEVAMRLCAKPKTADYGAITVAINLRGGANIVAKVPREKFVPIPNVDSAVVKITVEKNKYASADLSAARDAVRCAFSSRRKMLVNNVMQWYKLNRAEAENALNNSGVSLTARGEELSAESFVKLSQNLPVGNRQGSKRKNGGK